MMFAKRGRKRLERVLVPAAQREAGAGKWRNGAYHGAPTVIAPIRYPGKPTCTEVIGREGPNESGWLLRGGPVGDRLKTVANRCL